MPQFIATLPTNTVVAGGKPVIKEYVVGANATPAKMVAGRIVIFDTVEYAVKEAGAAAHGVIGVLMEKPDEALDAAYAVGDVCRVITGGEDVIVRVLEVQNGGAINPGTSITTAADGKVAIAAVAAVGSQGDIIGEGVKIYADPASADTAIVMKLKIIPELKAIS
jgi:hypothetical protein